MVYIKKMVLFNYVNWMQRKANGIKTDLKNIKLNLY